MQQLKQQAIKSVFWVGSTQTLGQLISALVATVYLMKILSPEDYGVFGMALSYQAILFILYDLGIGVAIVQKQNLTEEDIHSAFWFSTTFGVILFALSWYLAVLCGAFYSAHDVVAPIRVLAISNIFLAIKEVPYCIMAKRFEFKRRGFAELLAGLICMAVSLILAIKGFEYWSLIIGQLIREICLCILILFLSNWKIRFCFQISSIKSLLRFGIPITGQSLLNYLNQGSDSVIIGRFLGKNPLGYYQTALSIAMMPIQKVIVIANKVAFPVFSQLQSDNEKMKAYFYKVFHLISLFSFPVFFGLYCVAEEVIVVILDPKWLPSLFVIKAFCFIAIFRSYIGFLLIILKAKGNTGAVFRYSLYSSIVLPAAFLVGVQFGISGVALAWLMCFPALFFYLLWLVKKEIHISFIDTWNKIFHTVLASIVMILCVLLLKRSLLVHYSMSYGTLGASVAVGVAVFFGYYGLFHPQIFFEIRQLKTDLVS
jgi:teichuronic acid exporter